MQRCAQSRFARMPGSDLQFQLMTLGMEGLMSTSLLDSPGLPFCDKTPPFFFAEWGSNEMWPGLRGLVLRRRAISANR